MKIPEIPLEVLPKDTEVIREKLKPEIIELVASGERNWVARGQRWEIDLLFTVYPFVPLNFVPRACIT